MSDGNELPVEYDMSFSTNSRINYLLWVCNQSATNDEPIAWLNACKNLLKETSTAFSEPDFKAQMNTKRTAEIAASEYLKYAKDYQINNHNYAFFCPPRKIFDTLYDWEITLRKKLDKMGLLFKRSDSAYEAMI